MGTSRLLCELLGQPPGHQNWNLQTKAEVGNLFPFGPVAQGCGPKSVEIATGLVSFLEAPDIEKKTKFRSSRTPRAMKLKHAQTRYQLVQTYFINISTTSHRARAVRIHPSRAVFRKDEKFSVPLHFRRKPKKSSNARKQKTKERGISRSIHTRAIQSIFSFLSREDDNHRRRQKRMLYAYLRHFIFT